MAEQEKKTFKWGDREYLLDDLLSMHAAQENNYYNFAKTRGQYDETALQGLRQAITNRINAVKSGQEFSGDGVLDTDIADNTRIQTQKKGLFKKEKYVDQDNTEWAKYYLNKLVSNLKPYEKAKPVEQGYNVDQHGFGAYLKGQGLNAKEIFEKNDLRDEENPDNPRAYTQRHDILRKQLTGYRDWLASKNFDFTKNDNEWDDNILSDLNALVNSEKFDNSTLAASLRKLGAGDEYTTAFTSDKYELSENSGDAEKRKQEKRDKEWNAYKEGLLSDFNALERMTGQMNQYIGKDKDFNVSDEDLAYYMDSVKISGAGAEKAHWDKLDADYKANPYNAAVAQIILPMKAKQGRLGTIQSGNYTGWMYDPDTKNSSRNSVMAFDPISGKQEEIFIGHVTDDWNRIKNKWMIDNNYLKESAQFNKEGGILEFQTGGTFSSYEMAKEYKEKKNKEKAAQTGKSEKVQASRDRVVSNGDDSFTSDDPTLSQPNAGFTAAEKVRLGSIAADIGSIFLDPISGTAVGLASTGANFVADVMDDGMQLSDWGNLAVNAGFDLLGAIPVFGDAVGTGAKITRKLAKFAPRVMASLAAYQGIANFDGIMNSWSKFASGDKDQKLTVQDWRNIAQSISLVTGGIRATKNKAAQNAMKTKARVDDVVGINVYDKQAKQTKQILVDGETAKNIRAAQGDKTKVEAELAKLEEFKDKFGESGTLEVLTKGHGPLQSPIHRTTRADGSKSFELRSMRGEGRAQVTDVYDFSRVPEGYGSFWGYQSKRGEQLTRWHQGKMEQLNKSINPLPENHRGALTVAEVDAQVKALNDPLNAQVESMKTAMARRTAGIDALEAQTKTTLSEVQALQRKLHGLNKNTVSSELAGLHGATKGLRSLELEVQSKKQQVTSLDSQIKALDQQIALEKSNGLPTGNLEARKNNLETQLTASQTQLTAIEAQLTALRTSSEPKLQRQAELENALKDFEKLRILQKRLGNLHNKSAQAATTNHTREYLKLEQMISDLQTNHSNIGGRDLQWDMSDILNRAGVTNAFKTGGNINRNKINKFLNYAKG